MDYGCLDMQEFNLLKEFGPEERLTLLIARWLVNNQTTLKIKESLIPKDIVWERFRQSLRYHQLSPFAYFFFRKTPYLLPDKEKELLKQSYHSCVISQSYLWQEFIKILDTFNNKGIEFVPLKGIAIIIDNIYADKTYLRPMCDIDLLIKEKGILPFIEKTLEDLGYEKWLGGMREEYWKKKNYHIGFIKNQDRKLFYYTEVHWALDYKRDKPMLPNLWNRLKKSQVEGKDVCLLSPEDTLFSLALHQRRFGGKTLCFKNVCDATMLLKRYNGKLDWDYILREAKTACIRTTLYFILTQANLFFSVQIPSFVIDTLDVPNYKKRLIRRFIVQNTFTSSLGSNDIKIDTRRFSYLKSHFLLYDNLWGPVENILNIPQEQFAKFYRLKPYASKTNLFYKIRYLYFLNSLFGIIIRSIAKRVLDFFKNL